MRKDFLENKLQKETKLQETIQESFPFFSTSLSKKVETYTPRNNERVKEENAALVKFAQNDFYGTTMQSAKPGGKGYKNRQGNNKENLDCYGMDIAPLHIFENQVIPVEFGDD